MRTWLLILALAVTAAGVVLFVLARQEPAPIVVAPRDAAAAPPVQAPAPPPRFTAAPAPIDAPTAPAPELATLRSSGTSAEVWVPQAKTLLRGFDPKAEVECYVAGCAAKVSFDSEAAYEQAVDVIRNDETWTGGKKWLTPERAPGGTITAVLILYRPD